MRDGVQTYSLPSALIHLVVQEYPFSLGLPEETQAIIKKTSHVGLRFMVILIYN